jgi:hypothetical protein
MFIKLECRHCGEVIEVEEINLIQEPELYRNCSLCSYKLEVKNLDEIVKFDIYKKAEAYLNKWVTEMGLEGCIELVERHKDQSCYRIYKEILEKRGLKIK